MTKPTRGGGTSRKDRIVTTSIAVASTVGVAGLLGYQIHEANEQKEYDQYAAQADQQALDIQVAQLAAEREQLDQYRADLLAYRDELAKAAGAMSVQAQDNTQPAQAAPAPQAIPAPKPVPAVKPAPKPQATTRGS